MGCAFDAKEVDVGGKSVRVELWDTAGIARYREMVANHYPGATCVMLVYDVSDRRTFEAAVGGWLSDARRVAPSSAAPAVVLVGNKADRGDPRRAVSTEEAAQYAERHGFGFAEVSTLDSAGVEAWFHHVVTELCRCADSGASFAVGGQPEQTAVPAAEAPLGVCAAVVAGAGQQAGNPPLAAPAACAATTAGAGGDYGGGDNGGGGGGGGGKSDGDSDSSSSSDEE
jgi:small GTP-binding protein